MDQVYPACYPHFRCIADRCRHSCCIGWEIDLDEKTLKKYQKAEGELGEKLRKNIAAGEDGAHFILGEGERCPFLNEKNLCELILAWGENCLCQICADHPRFRSFFDGREEIGLGLCCEEAGRILLSWQEPMMLMGETESEAGEEREFFSIRQELFDLCQKRTLPLKARMRILWAYCALENKRTLQEYAEIFLSLEYMDEKMPRMLQRLAQTEGVSFDPGALEIPFEQLLWYMLFRHLAGALEDDLYAERTALCLLNVEMICVLWQMEGERTLESLIEIARMYSAEIEYSDENIQVLLEAIQDAEI